MKNVEKKEGEESSKVVQKQQRGYDANHATALTFSVLMPDSG